MSKAKQCKAIAEQAIQEMFEAENLSWDNAAHPVCTFYVKGHKFMYSIASTPKADYTLAKTKSMMKNALLRKALMWKYVTDATQFESKFMKG